MHASAGGGGPSQPSYGSGAEHEHYDDHAVVGVAAAGTEDGGRASADYDERDYHWQVSSDVSYLIPFQSDFRSLTRFALSGFLVEDECNSFGVFLAGDTIDLKSGSLPDQAVDSLWMLESGVLYHHYFSPPHVFFNPYFTVSAAGQLLVWSYRHPVISDGDTITSDELGGFDGYMGVGLAAMRNQPLSFFAEVGVGATAFLDTTVQSFHNDVFSDYSYFSVKAPA